MPRPVLSDISMLDAAWLTKLNSNFSTVTEKPFAVYQLPGASPSFGVTPALFTDCLGIKNASVQISNGTAWKSLVPAPATYTTVLNPATATVANIVTAYNSLRSTLIASGWMKSS